MDTQTKNICIGIGIGIAIHHFLLSKKEEEEVKPKQQQEIEKQGTTASKILQNVNNKAAFSSPKKIPRKAITEPKVNQIHLTNQISRAEQCFPNAIATISSNGQQQTYTEFCRRTRCAGTAFVDELGVQPGDRIAIISMNSPAYLEAFYSVSFAGGLIVPLNYRLTTDDLADALNDCTCKYLLIDSAFTPFLDELLSKVKSIQKVIGLGEDSFQKEIPRMNVLIERNKPIEEAVQFKGTELIPSNVYGLFYTGGTTGKARAAMLTHEGISFNTYAIINTIRFIEGIRYLHAGPMFHLADGTATFGVTSVGGTHLFVPKFVPDAVLRLIQDHKVTHTLFVPSMFQMLLRVPNLRDFDLRSVRYFYYGGARMPEQFLTESMKIFPGAKFVQGYGMTEASPLMTFLSAENHFSGSPLLGSVGQCVPHGVLKILDQNDNEVPRGTIGEICYRGPNVMVGYYNRAESTEATLKNGWLRTGDGGKMNEQGYVFICDRIKDVIKTAGETVFSQEVEFCLLALPGVLNAAVIGVPDSVYVEKVAAILVVEKNSTLTEAKVMDHCKSKMAGYKCPRLVVFQIEPLPMSGPGKVLKNVLREPFWKGTDVNIYSQKPDVTSLYDSSSSSSQ